MTQRAINNWQGVQDEVRARINARLWKPGELIPNEAALATEFGCARATVNRALQALADQGLLDRRRKAGTRVATHPVRKATLDIPVIRNEITEKGSRYGYNLIGASWEVPPGDILARLGLHANQTLLHVLCLHLADGVPYVLENRWINQHAVPAVDGLDFTSNSPNEWLVENVPLDRGDITFSATTASNTEAELLGCLAGEGLFVIDRRTWTGSDAITSVRLIFAPGYRMHTEI